ncbi:acyl-CoA dehydrogenase family protein [Rhodococcus erythropolis]|uniref:Acyl-CoA dehydrogenase/oxidase C-terminal domain-containing protein n=1 Tax=Rhodococcus erythropolis TaxID=1833 RepID=A0A8I1A3L6_RHOER|nr:hypothetical protein [Rhodococcus erythropolis]
MEDTTEFALNRRQFGGPVSDLQAIRFKLADVATQIETNRQIIYASTTVDSGGRCDLEATVVDYSASEMSEGPQARESRSTTVPDTQVSMRPNATGETPA